MKNKVLCILAGFTAMLILLSPNFVDAQPLHPMSVDLSLGVHIVSCDTIHHRSSQHYEALCCIVLTEFGLPADSICLTVVFVDAQLMAALKRQNADRFDSDTWQGFCVNPYLVMINGEREADDTFMHEYMHALQQQGKLFQKVPKADVHQLIYLNEGLLMGSKSYLDYLRAHPPPKEKDDE